MRPSQRPARRALPVRADFVPVVLERLECRRLLAAGVLDPTFGNAGTVATTFPGGNYGVVDAALQPDGRIVAVGAAAPGQQTSGFQLLRYEPDGSLDTSFGTAGHAPAPPTMAGWVPLDLALAPDGDIVVAGGFVHLTLGRPDYDFAVVRFNADGSLDSGFGNDGVILRDWSDMSRANAVAVQPDSKVLAAGFTTWSGDKLGVLRFNADGTTDTSFGVAGIAQTEPSGLGWTAATYSMALGGDGKILVGGSAGNGTDFGATVVRFNADGSPDRSLNGTGSVTLANVQYPTTELYGYDDGRILMAGEEHLARLLENGELDPAFSPNGRRANIYRSIFGIDVAPDGKIVTTSEFENFATFRYRPDGGSDGAWGPFGGYVTTQIPGGTAATGTWDQTRAVLTRADGKIVALGSANGGTSFGLARYRGDQSPPVVAGARFVLMPRQELQFVFGEPVTGLGLDDLHVVNDATGQRVPPSQFFMNSSGTAVGADDATWIPVNPLPGGDYRAILPAGSVSNANGIPIDEYVLPFTIPAGDVTPPRVSRAAFVVTPQQQIQFDFSEDVVGSLGLDDLVLTNLATGQRVGTGGFFLNARGGPDFPTEAAWVTFNDLPGGNYRATLPAASVSDPAGNTLFADATFTFTVADPAPYVTSAQLLTYFEGMGKKIELQFSEGLTESTVRAADFFITDRATGLRVPGIGLRGFNGGVGGTTRAEWGGEATMPTGDYRATLPADSVRDESGNPMASDFHWDFRIGSQRDNERPTVRASFMDWPVPQHRFRFEFSEEMTWGIDRDRFRVTNLDTAQALPASAFTGSGYGPDVADWRAVQPLPAGRYRAMLPAAAARDRYGNSLAADAVLDFEITGPGDRTAPTVVSAGLDPGNPGLRRILIRFSEDVRGTVDDDDIVVTDLTTGRVLPPYHFNGSGGGGGPESPTHAVWTPGSPLPHGPYRATLRAGSVADPGGNALAADHTFEFTVPNEDTLPPYVWSRGLVRGDRPYIEYSFFEDVFESIDPGDLVLTNTTTGQVWPADQLTVESLETRDRPAVARWYPTAPLPPGRYTATLTPGGITDRAGNFLAGPNNLAFDVSGVVGRHLFYNNSAFDGRDPAPGAADHLALATDKTPLLPGEAPTFANVSSYAKGINGVMIDVVGLPTAVARGLIAADFDFGPGVPAPTIVVRRGGGTHGADRVSLTWPDGTILNQWLGVKVVENSVTALATADRFWFGNLVGETGDGATTLRVNALDLTNVRRNLNSSGSVTSAFDFDRDGRVTALDLAAVKRNLFAQLAPPAVAASPIALSGSGPIGATDWLKGA